MSIEKGTIDVGDLSAYLARPAGGSKSGMLLLPMITGIGEQLRAWAHELAEAGTTALVWDVFHGVNSDNTPFEELFPKLGALADDAALAEQTALLDHLLGDLGCTQAGVIGWCLGGRFALLLAAQDPRLSGVVAYHPTVPRPLPANHTLDALELAPRITAPVLVSYPSADSLVSPDVFADLQAALQSRSDGATFTQYFPGAEHGFSNVKHQGNPVNAAAYSWSWPQTLAFLASLRQ